MKVAVAAVDPGGTSGLFAAVVTLGGSMRETCGLGLESVLKRQVDGPFRRQARVLEELIRDWMALANIEGGVGLDAQYLMIEDWDTGRMAPGTELIAVWIAAALDGRLTIPGTAGENLFDGGERLQYNTASRAKGYATDRRLKHWGLYTLTVGLPHARDASRHWALGVNRLIR